jgi:hypothetical protein
VDKAQKFLMSFPRIRGLSADYDSIALGSFWSISEICQARNNKETTGVRVMQVLYMAILTRLKAKIALAAIMSPKGCQVAGPASSMVDIGVSMFDSIIEVARAVDC